MTKPWAAWKVTIMAVVASLVVLMILSGASSSKNPEQAGEEVGMRYGWILLLVPLVAYIIQKVRLDSWNAKNSALNDDNLKR